MKSIYFKEEIWDAFIRYVFDSSLHVCETFRRVMLLGQPNNQNCVFLWKDTNMRSSGVVRRLAPNPALQQPWVQTHHPPILRDYLLCVKGGKLVFLRHPGTRFMKTSFFTIRRYVCCEKEKRIFLTNKSLPFHSLENSFYDKNCKSKRSISIRTFWDLETKKWFFLLYLRLIRMSIKFLNINIFQKFWGVFFNRKSVSMCVACFGVYMHMLSIRLHLHVYTEHMYALCM